MRLDVQSACDPGLGNLINTNRITRKHFLMKWIVVSTQLSAQFVLYFGQLQLKI